MGRFTKRLVAGLAAALALTGGAFADFLLDDLEGGSNENRMGNYWYVWVSDDGKVAEGLAYDRILSNAGPADGYGKWTFKPFVGTSGTSIGAGTSGSAALIYKDLDLPDAKATVDAVVEEWKGGGWNGTTPSSLYPVVGMGTLLTEGDDIGYGEEFKKVDTIVFYMKGDAGIKVIFKVETIENSMTGRWKPTQTAGPYDPNPANAYSTVITVTTDWTRYAVPMKPISPITVAEGAVVPGSPTAGNGGGVGGAATSATAIEAMNEGKGLYQQTYWGKSFTFKPENVTKIAWQVNKDLNSTKLSGSVYVDSIQFKGPFTFVPQDQCLDCVGKAFPTGPKFLISDFETGNDLLQNKLGFWWYPYTDAKARTDGTTPSSIDEYWTENAYTGQDVLDVVGHGNGGNGITVNFTTGPSPFIQTRGSVSQSLTAFAGIGTNLFDTTAIEGQRTYANATGATGLYFEYKTDGVDFLTVEFPDRYDINQAGPEGDNDDGQVWYKKIPGNNTSEWKGVIIPFANLSLPGWIKSSDRKGKNPAGNWKQPHDLSRLAKIQFKYQGTSNGTIAIDNVYLLGIESIGAAQSVKTVGSAAKSVGLSAVYSRGKIGVNWNAATAVASGKIQLVNTKGRVVASAPIAQSAGRTVTANLGAGSIPTGMYFVRVNAKDVNGKKIVSQAPISIVK